MRAHLAVRNLWNERRAVQHRLGNKHAAAGVKDKDGDVLELFGRGLRNSSRGHGISRFEGELRLRISDERDAGRHDDRTGGAAAGQI